jgi:hypothetical protein
MPDNNIQPTKKKRKRITIKPEPVFSSSSVYDKKKIK